MRQWINNPRFVLAMVAVAGLLLAWQYVPVDWARQWETLLLGEANRMMGEVEAPLPEEELPTARLYAAKPASLPLEWEKNLSALDIPRALFPVPASPSEKKWQQQNEGPRFPEGLRLQAVYEDGGQKIAVVSGNLVREGDYLRGAKVTRIARDRVTFQWMENHQDLLLGGEEGVVAAAPVPPPVTEAESQPPAPGDSSALLQGELERLRQLQKLLETPAKLLKGSEQAPSR